MSKPIPIDHEKASAALETLRRQRTHAADLLAGVEQSLQWHRDHGIPLDGHQYLIVVSRRPTGERMRVITGLMGHVAGTRGGPDPATIETMVYVDSAKLADRLRVAIAQADELIALAEIIAAASSIRILTEDEARAEIDPGRERD